MIVTLDAVRELGSSGLQDVQGFVEVANPLSATGHRQRPLGFVRSHLSGALVQGDRLLRHVHLREVRGEPADHVQVRRVMAVRLRGRTIKNFGEKRARLSKVSGKSITSL